MATPRYVAGVFGHDNPFKTKGVKILAPPPQTPRMKRLRALTADKQAIDVPAALKHLWSQGSRPPRTLFRRQFARLDRPASGTFSDRALPPPHKRPPSTRLIRPRGVAQAFFLTMLFVAQCERQAGQVVGTDRRLTDPNPDPDLPPWADLVMVPAEHTPGTKGYNRAD
jgi:hypothetical protein